MWASSFVQGSQQDLKVLLRVPDLKQHHPHHFYYQHRLYHPRPLPETDPFQVFDDEAPDIHELELTGVKTNTTYTKDSVVTTVNTEKDNDEATVTQILGKTDDGLVAKHDVGGKSISTMTPDDIVLEHDKANMTLDDSQAKLEMGQSQVVVEDGTTYVGVRVQLDKIHMRKHCHILIPRFRVLADNDI